VVQGPRWPANQSARRRPNTVRLRARLPAQPRDGVTTASAAAVQASLQQTSTYLNATLRAHESTQNLDESPPLANKPTPRLPACSQAGSRRQRELLYSLKDSWRGRRDSNPPPLKLRRDLAVACRFDLIRGMRRRTRGLRVTVITSRGQHTCIHRLTAGATPGCHGAERHCNARFRPCVPRAGACHSGRVAW